MAAAEPYSKVPRQTWTDPRFLKLSAPKPNARDLWQYLLTGKRVTSLPGLMAVGVLGLADDLHWNHRATKKCLDEIERAGLAVVDHEAKLIWLPEVFETNMPANPSVVVGWSHHWRALPECPLRARATADMEQKLREEDALRGTTANKSAALALAFEVATGAKTRAEAGLQVGRPRALPPQIPQESAGSLPLAPEHGVPARCTPTVGGLQRIRNQRSERSEKFTHARARGGVWTYRGGRVPFLDLRRRLVPYLEANHRDRAS